MKRSPANASSLPRRGCTPSVDCVRGAAMPPDRRDGSTRRSASAVVLCLALGARVATAEPPATAPSKPEVQTRESQVAMTPSQALDRLKAGNARFVANATRRRDWSAKVVATASGQFPFAAVLGCMDSRVPVEIAFDQGIGDVFGVRVAGNVVNDDELGSLEYAVKVGTKLIVVLGHTDCGAVKGAVDERSPRPRGLASLAHRSGARRRATRDPGPQSGERCSS